MAGEVVLSAVIANCGRQRSDDLRDAIASGAPDVPVYRPQYEARGGQVFAHIGDWQAVLGTGADLIAYGSLLWAAYNKFVRPHIDRAQGHRPTLLIVLSAGGRNRAHIAIEEDWTEAQIQSVLAATVDQLRQQAADEGLELDWDFTDSVRWARLSPRQHS